MFSASITLLLLAQAGCEWVEISQQHYKKPIRPTHNHPLLATPGFASNTERTTKANRIYINQSLHENHWNIDDLEMPNFNANGVKLESSKVKFKDHDVFSDRRPEENERYNNRVKEDTYIIRKQQPVEDVTEDNSKRQRVPVAGNVMRVRPTKKSTSTRKPLDDPIEVLNLSDLEYGTGFDDSTRPEFDADITSVRTTKIKQNTTPKAVLVSRVRPEKTSSTKLEPTNRKKGTPRPETVEKEEIDSNMHQPFTTKTNNIRRVEIKHGVKTTTVGVNANSQQGPQRPTKASKIETTDVIFSGVGRLGTTPYKFPNLGHVKRVQLTSNTTKVTHRRDPTINIHTSTELPYDDDKQETIHRTKPISRSSTTERYSSKKMNAEKVRFENRNDYKIPNPEDVMIEEILNDDDGIQDYKVYKVASVGVIKRVSSTIPTPVKVNKLNNNKHGQVKPFAESTPELETDGEVLVEDEETSDNLNGVYFTGKLTTKIDEMPVVTTFKPKRHKIPAIEKPEVSTQIERYEKNPYRPVRPSHEPFPEFVTKEEHFVDDGDFEGTTEGIVNALDSTTESPQRTTTLKRHNSRDEKPAPQRKKNKIADQESESENPSSSEIKPSTMENLIKFLKTVTDIITKNTRRGVRSKMQYLEDLRDTILANIEERIEAAFPDDGAPRRRTRSAVKAQARGHVEFPSSESALMTISFLTFAVYLIKLVLQVIQAYKQKTMMMMPTVVAAVGRAFNERHTQH